MAKGNLDAAQDLFKRVVAKDPANAIAHYDLGVIHQQRNQVPEALAEYQMALQSNPAYVPALFNTAVIYGATQPAKAIDVYRRIVILQPNAPTAYLNLGLLERANGMAAQGIRDIQTALKQDPTLVSGLPGPVLAEVRASPSPASPSLVPSPSGSG